MKTETILKDVETRVENGEKIIVPSPKNLNIVLTQIGQYYLSYYQGTINPNGIKKHQENEKVFARSLIEIITNGIKDNTISSDQYQILNANIKSNAFGSIKVPKLGLDSLNATIKSILDEDKKEAKENNQPISEAEKASIVSEPLDEVKETHLTKIEINKGEWFTFDKIKGTVTLYVEATKQSVTKTIDDFKKKGWRQSALDFIKKVLNAIVDGFVWTKNKISSGASSVKSKVTGWFKRTKDIKEAQPDPIPS